MRSERRPPSVLPRYLFALLLIASVTGSFRTAAAQGLTGALIGTVRDGQGGALPGALVRLSSPGLLGGPQIITTNQKGQMRFPVLPPGLYELHIEFKGFAPYHEERIRVGANATLERTVILALAEVEQSVGCPGANLAHRGARSGIQHALWA
jgi:Carboxypeptidase regulatory-like domain